MPHSPRDDQNRDRKPVIRPRHHLPGGPAGSPDHALRRLEESERLEQVLLHELAGLLDGSTRFLRLARRELKEGRLTTVAAAAALNHLGAAESALSTMASMIERTRNQADDRPHPRFIVAPQPIHIAIDAAVAHTQHLAAEQGIRISTSVDASALGMPPLPLYPLFSNAIRNAIESHAASGGQSAQDATISIAARADSGGVLTVTIEDNAQGLSEELIADPSLAFSLGYTNRPGGSGVGLALCADIVSSLGGTISLGQRENGSGAILIAHIPSPTDEVSG